MSKPSYDAIVVGSGTGGATVAYVPVIQLGRTALHAWHHDLDYGTGLACAGVFG